VQSCSSSTKWDLLDDFGRQRLERLWETEFERVTWAQRVNLSALTGWHTNRLLSAMETALVSWDKRIPTGRLNAFLGADTGCPSASAQRRQAATHSVCHPGFEQAAAIRHLRHGLP
jgi:predicted GTPase